MNGNVKEKIEALQCKEGLTDEDLGRRMGLSRSGVAHIKRSQRPRLKTIQRIAEAFGVDPAYFFK